jgi:vacuolar-type H+-ATPase subunit E/Vma4
MLSPEDEAKSIELREKLNQQVRALNNDDCVIKVLVRDGKTVFAQSVEIEIGDGLVTGTRIIPAKLPSLERVKAILEDSLQQVVDQIAKIEQARQSQVGSPELN